MFLLILFFLLFLIISKIIFINRIFDLDFFLVVKELDFLVEFFNNQSMIVGDLWKLISNQISLDRFINYPIVNNLDNNIKITNNMISLLNEVILGKNLTPLDKIVDLKDFLSKIK